MISLDNAQRKAHGIHAKGNHWWVQVIGTDPDYQRKGFGGRMLDFRSQKSRTACQRTWILQGRRMKTFTRSMISCRKVRANCRFRYYGYRWRHSRHDARFEVIESARQQRVREFALPSVPGTAGCEPVYHLLVHTHTQSITHLKIFKFVSCRVYRVLTITACSIGDFVEADMGRA